MPNYQNGKIYSIRSHLTDDVYIGSTIETLAKRLFNHKRYYKQWLNKKTNYTSSYKIIEKDFENCYIELVENYPCNNKNELCRREGEIIRNTTCINKNIAGRTQKEWGNDNKENSSILGLGDYKGGKTRINGLLYDIRNKIISFNGKKYLHSNDLSNNNKNRYSLVFFKL